MYLAICQDQQEDLDAVCSTLDNVAVRRKVFHSAAEMLESARQERFAFYLPEVMILRMNGMEAAREIRRFDDAAGTLKDFEKEAASRWLAYHLEGGR